MNNSRIFDAIVSRPAAVAAAGLVILFILGLAVARRPHRKAPDMTLYTNSAPVQTTRYERPTVPVVSFSPQPPPAPPAPLPPPPVKTNLPFVALHYHVQLPPDTNPPPLGLYAPAGRLIRCVLVNTVDSANIDTPIIALVTDDLWHDGRIVIPAGTEVHGKASIDRMRERIVASGSWTLVWQSGEELVVRGIALDREEGRSGTGWGITDGSAGLKGQICKSDSNAEIKMFLATFMSAVASGLQESRTTVFGSQISGTARNAALAGTSQVMNTYAQQVLEAIRRDGVYVRVAAGKQMYLYIIQTLDHSQARIGNLRVAASPPAAFSIQSPPPTKP